VMIHLMPGDPAYILAGDNATEADLDAVRHQLGLDQSLPVQYILWINQVLHGNLGTSMLSHQPIAKLLADRAPATLELTVVAMILAVAVAVPVGMLGATHSRGKLDVLISTLQSVWLAIPSFWAGILGIVVFAIVLRWLPPGGRVADSRDISDSIKSLLLPAACLALYIGAGLSRIVKANVLEVYSDDYVRTARAKGLGSRRVAYEHVLRNALIPVVTVLGLQFAGLLGGTVVIESVFSWPGVGTLMLDAITSRDYAVVQAGLLFMVLLFIAVNLLVDVSYALIDPRIRLGGG
jgi:peptide/nickel transport system permease protein